MTKTIYEIIDIGYTQGKHCAFVSSYKKALDYVYANVERIYEIKIDEHWQHDTTPPARYKGETKLFSSCSYCGYYSDGFLIKQHQVI